MNDFRSAVWTPMKTTSGLEDALPTAQQRYAALGICVTLVLAAAFGARFGQGAAPEIRSFVSIAATARSLADLLTAFLLLAQFYVNGTVLFGILAAAYGFSGLVTWAYLAAFPRVVRAATLTPADQQIPIVLWTLGIARFPRSLSLQWSTPRR